MDRGSRAVGTVRVLLVLGAILLVVVVAAVVVGPFGAPTVAGVSNHFGGVTAEETVIVSEVTVDNPNPVGLGTDDVTVAYAVDMNDVRMATGEKAGVAVGTGESVITLETAMLNGNVPEWWVSHLRNGERSEVVVHATVSSEALNESVDAPEVRETVDTDIESSFNTTERRPIEAGQEPVVEDPVLYVEETRGWWGQVSDETTAVQMRFEVTNPKPYPISVQEVGYDISMNGIYVGEGSTDRPVTIPPGETRTVAAELFLNNGAFDDWWVSHLERNQRTEFVMALSLVVDLSEAGGPTLSVPVGTIEHEFETDVFGNKAQYPTGTASTTGGADTPTATDEVDGGGTATDPADDDGGATSTPSSSPTPSPTPTPTPTPSPTPTDDGLLDIYGSPVGATVRR